MFAILLSEENRHKINATGKALDPRDQEALDVYQSNPRLWYFVSGFVTMSGQVWDWTIIPEYMLAKRFEYDPDKIKTDWDQIVRK